MLSFRQHNRRCRSPTAGHPLFRTEIQDRAGQSKHGPDRPEAFRHDGNTSGRKHAFKLVRNSNGSFTLREMTRKIHPQFRENQISDAPSRGNCARIDCSKRANTAPPDCPAVAFESSAPEIPVKADSIVDRIAGLRFNNSQSWCSKPSQDGCGDLSPVPNSGSTVAQRKSRGSRPANRGKSPRIVRSLISS